MIVTGLLLIAAALFYEKNTPLFWVLVSGAVLAALQDIVVIMMHLTVGT